MNYRRDVDAESPRLEIRGRCGPFSARENSDRRDSRAARRSLVIVRNECGVLDFARVSGIDAHGLGVLLELRCQLELKGIEFRLMNVTNLVGEVLAITKLDAVFQLTTETETLSTIARNCEQTEARDEFPNI